MDEPLSPLASALISTYEEEKKLEGDRGISVNPVIAEVASFYEKLRTAMDFREDEVILRGAIERILKRRMLMGRDSRKIALPLVRELLWARYFPEGTIQEDAIDRVAESIELHMLLQQKIMSQHKIDESKVTPFIRHVMSSDIAYLLRPNREKDSVANFMYQVMRESVKIEDDSEETRNVQVFIAVRKAFAKDDIAFLRFHLFRQFFGTLTKHSLEQISERFVRGYQDIEQQLKYPLKEKIHSYIRRQTPVFFILDDIFRGKKGGIRSLVKDEQAFKDAVSKACLLRYNGIKAKIRRAIIRSVIFILLTKVVFAFLVEGTYERALYGHIVWSSIAINTGIPPLLMVIVGLLIKTPGSDNTKRIYTKLKLVLFTDKPRLANELFLKKTGKKTLTGMDIVFNLLWLFAFALSFGGIWLILGKIHFSLISRLVFIFFITIVSFIAYRIYQTANMYTIGDRQSWTTPIIDFFFLPIVQVGRRLTEGISQVNIFLFLFDFIIEMPFKAMFAFLEQWFVFLHAKREELE